MGNFKAPFLGGCSDKKNCKNNSFLKKYPILDLTLPPTKKTTASCNAQQTNERKSFSNSLMANNRFWTSSITQLMSRFTLCISRFENTVRAQFFGHTHNDQFLVFYDAATQSRPVNLGFVTPSVTTYTGMNPSYTIYTVDGPGDEASYVSSR